MNSEQVPPVSLARRCAASRLAGERSSATPRPLPLLERSLIMLFKRSDWSLGESRVNSLLLSHLPETVVREEE